MDSLDLLENFTALFFSLLPLLGWSMRRRLTDIIFGGTNYELETDQKEEILRRVEFASLLVAALVMTQDLVLTLLAYHHDALFGVLAAVATFYFGFAFVLWLWNLGPSGLRAFRSTSQVIISAVPFVLLVTKIIVIVLSVGFEWDTQEGATKAGLKAAVPDLPSPESKTDRTLKNGADQAAGLQKQATAIRPDTKPDVSALALPSNHSERKSAMIEPPENRITTQSNANDQRKWSDNNQGKLLNPKIGRTLSNANDLRHTAGWEPSSVPTVDRFGQWSCALSMPNPIVQGPNLYSGIEQCEVIIVVPARNGICH